MNKKILVTLAIILILTAAFAGCFGEEKVTKPQGPTYEDVIGDYPRESGWLDSDMGDNTQLVDSTLPLDINFSARITIISIGMRFEDSDSAHQESDEGSDPDEISISLTNGDNTTEVVTGMTPCNLQVQMNSTKGSHLTGDWQINVHATCGAGKPFTFIPRPGNIAFLQYKDQGIYYDLEVSYTYLEEV